MVHTLLDSTALHGFARTPSTPQSRNTCSASTQDVYASTGVRERNC